MLLQTSRSVLRSSAVVPQRTARTGIAISSSLQHPRVISNTRFVQSQAFLTVNQRKILLRRTFHSSPASRKGISPQSEEPLPPNPEPHATSSESGRVLEATNLTDAEYHAVSEYYLNVLLAELEKAQEEGSETEAEYSVS